MQSRIYKKFLNISLYCIILKNLEIVIKVVIQSFNKSSQQIQEKFKIF